MEYKKATWVPGMTLKKMEELVIKEALIFYKNNKTKTAKKLGIAIRTVDHKIEKYRHEATMKRINESKTT
jgi:transcriptional regulator with PAS, ATPase and Fis domain